MSVKWVKVEIDRFLAKAEPEVLCISGKWGVGKTYTWNYYLKEAKQARRITLEKYAYVSLFGLKNLEDLRFAIFDETKATDEIGEKWKFDDFKLEKSEVPLSALWRKVVGNLSKNQIGRASCRERVYVLV